MPKPDPNVCTAQELRFVDAYVANGGNGAAAAREAGYSDRNEGAKVRASKLMDRARVRHAVERRRLEVKKLAEDADKLARDTKLAELVRERSEKLIAPIANGEQLQRLWSAIAFGEVEGYSESERLRASELLAKSHGMFVQDKELPPAPSTHMGDGDGPRVHVQILMMDNGRGPKPPPRPLSAGEEHEG